MRTARRFIVLFLLFLFLLPLLFGSESRAVTVDEPLFLWTTRRILETPLDFFGFDVNWYGKTMPMSRVMLNPPLMSHYLALVSQATGLNDSTLRLAGFIPSAFFLLGVAALARRLEISPAIPVVMAALSPAFLLTADSFMCDLPAATLILWSVILWERGLDGSRGSLLAGAFLAGLAALTKYSGVVVIPLLLMSAILRERKITSRAAVLLLPVAIIAAFHLFFRLKYGFWHLHEAAVFSTRFRSIFAPDFHARILTGLAFLGGASLFPLWALPFAARRRDWAIAALFSAAVIVLLAAGVEMGDYSFVRKETLILQFSLFALAGTIPCFFSLEDAWKKRDALSLLLAAWIFLFLFFGLFLNWSVNGRGILPLLAPVAVVMGRRITAPAGRAWLPFAAFALVGGFIAFQVRAADLDWTDASRKAARMICASEQSRNGVVRFQGHWGFQWYMEELGAIPVDFSRKDLKSGELLAIPRNNYETLDPSPETARLEEKIRIKGRVSFSTMEHLYGSGWYADFWGSLPFTWRWSGPPTEVFEVYRIIAPGSNQQPSPVIPAKAGIQFGSSNRFN